MEATGALSKVSFRQTPFPGSDHLRGHIMGVVICGLRHIKAKGQAGRSKRRAGKNHPDPDLLLPDPP